MDRLLPAWIRNSRFRDSPALRLTLASVLVQTASFAILPVISRIYTPADFNHYSLVLGFVGFSLAFTSLRYETAIISAGSQSDATALAWLAGLLCLPIGAAAALLLCLLKWLQIFGYEVIPNAVLLFAFPLMMLYSIPTTLRFLLTRLRAFGAISQITLIQGLGKCVLQIGLALPFERACAAILCMADCLGRIGGLAWVLRGRVGRGGRSLDARPRFAALSLAAVKYRQFALWGLPSGILDALAMALPLPVLTGIHGDTAGGQFALARGLMSLPVGLIGTNIADVFHERTARLARTTPEALLDELRGTTLKLLGLGALLAGGLTFVGMVSRAWMFPSDWAEVPWYLAATIPWAVAQCAVSPVSRIVFVVGGLKTKLIYDGCTIVGTWLVPILADRGGLGPIPTVAALSAYMALSYLGYFALMIWMVRRYVRAHQREEPAPRPC